MFRVVKGLLIGLGFTVGFAWSMRPPEHEESNGQHATPVQPDQPFAMNSRTEVQILGLAVAPVAQEVERAAPNYRLRVIVHGADWFSKGTYGLSLVAITPLQAPPDQGGKTNRGPRPQTEDHRSGGRSGGSVRWWDR